MKKTKIFLFLFLVSVMAAAVYAAPPHYLAIHVESSLPGNSEVVDLFAPATVNFNDNLYALGIGAAYEFAPIEYFSIGVGCDYIMKNFNMTVGLNTLQFAYTAIDPGIMFRGYYPLSFIKGAEVLAGAGGGYMMMLGSKLKISGMTNDVTFNGGTPYFKFCVGVTYDMEKWHNVIEIGYKLATIKPYNYDDGTTKGVMKDFGTPTRDSHTEFGGPYIGISSGWVFGVDPNKAVVPEGNSGQAASNSSYSAAEVAASDKTAAVSSSYSASETPVETKSISAAEATPIPTPAVTAEVSPEATLQATPQATAEATAVPTSEVTAEPTPAATIEAAATPAPTASGEKVEVDTSAQGGSDDGIVILSPGETSTAELEKYIMSKRKVEKPEETDNGEEVTISFEPEAGEEAAGVIVMEDQTKGKMEKTGYVMVERGGFISDNFKEDGTIYSLEGKDLLVAGDNIFMKLTIGKGVKKGTEFVIFDDSQVMINPMSDEDMGRKIKIVGVGRVVGVADADENIWKAKIIKSYDPAGNNFKIKLRKDIKDYYNKLITTIKKKAAPSEAFIISVSGGTQGIYNKDTVYIDRGLKDGIAPGDIMTVVRPIDDRETGTQKKYNEIGKIIIINTMRSSAVGIVKDATGVIKVGDIARTKTK